MLDDTQKHAIAAHGMAEVRAQWGRTDTRALGDAVADIRTRLEAGTWGQISFADDISERLRSEHAASILALDDPVFELDGPDLGDR